MAEKIKDLRNSSEADCKKKLQEVKLSLMKEYAQVAQGTTLKSPGKIKALKITRARLLTALREKKNEKAKKQSEKKESSKVDGRRV